MSKKKSQPQTNHEDPDFSGFPPILKRGPFTWHNPEKKPDIPRNFDSMPLGVPWRIKQSTRQELTHIAQRILCKRPTDQSLQDLFVIHEAYLDRHDGQNPPTVPIIKERCKNIWLASKKYLQTLNRNPLPSLYGQENLYRYLLESVNAYRDHAENLQHHFDGQSCKKSRRPRDWARHEYIRELAYWFEQETGMKPSGGTGARFPVFARECFYEIDDKKQLSDNLIRSALKRFRKIKEHFGETGIRFSKGSLLDQEK